MTLFEILTILLIHWFADFVLQTDKQAKGKSKNFSDLLDHTTNYSAVWIPGVMLLFYISNIELTSIKPLFLFFLITFIAHTITDYFTSRLNAKLWAKGNVHNFFVSIGFDQWLHYLQLFTTYYYLKQL